MEMTNEGIEDALAIVQRASKGPARWVEPATGVEDGRRNEPCEQFGIMLADGSRTDDGDYEVHGVSVPCDGASADSIGSGGDHRVVAITGNGPHSETNARMIALSLDPVYGYEAALLEVQRLRAELQKIRGGWTGRSA